MKTGIVVGASSGMGRAVARLLLQEGWRLGLAARREAPLQQLCKEFPQQVTVQVLDVTDNLSDQQLLALADQLGHVDLYFHAAGVGWQNPELQPDKELQTIQVNGMGFVRMVTTMYHYMKAQGGGHIAVISSIAGTKGLGPAPSYSATKAMQNTYIEALQQQSCTQGAKIAFTDIRPGFVDTPLIESSNFPMLMQLDKTAKQILKALKNQRKVVVLDWRYRILVFFWRLIPRALWCRLKLRK